MDAHPVRYEDDFAGESVNIIVRTGSLGELEKNPVTIALWKGLLVVKVMRNLKDVLRAFQGRRQAFLTSVWCVF